MDSREPGHGDVEAAIARVLDAQAAAVRAVEAAKIEAQQHLEAARARARRIDERTSARLQRMIQRIEADCAGQVALMAAGPASGPGAVAHDTQRLERIVAALAAELTGAQR